MSAGKALDFAIKAHAGQVRRYTGEPYINHPIAVAAIVGSVPGCTSEMFQAAFLHDVIEDCGVGIVEVTKEFGDLVGFYVWELTDPPAGGLTRVQRKTATRERLALAPASVQNIKLADLIDNTPTIVQHDPTFAKVYLSEKMDLINVLTEADAMLSFRARHLVWESQQLLAPPWRSARIA